MSSYYKKINGKNYDRTMLDITERSTSGKGDGRISLADSRSLLKVVKDGGKITDIEKRTLNYILENYKFTETALKHLEKSLADYLVSDINEEITEEKSDVKMVDASQIIKPSVPGKKGNKIFIFFLLLLIAVFAVFAVLKYFHKNTKTESARDGKQGEISAPLKDETASPKTDTAEITPALNKTEATAVKPLADNEYLVKDNDTLIKISEALYGDYRKWADIYKLNKGKIPNPTILYPGQVLIIPEKVLRK